MSEFLRWAAVITLAWIAASILAGVAWSVIVTAIKCSGKRQA